MSIILSACSARSQSQPEAGTAPSPGVGHVEACSTLGRMACAAMFMLTDDGSGERQSTCSARKTGSGARVETCGSVGTTAPTTAAQPRHTGVNPVQLFWSDNSSDEDVFAIERCDDVEIAASDKKSPICVGAWKIIGTVWANITSYVDHTARANHTYMYRVKATNGAGSSGYTNEMSITKPAR